MKITPLSASTLGETPESVVVFVVTTAVLTPAGVVGPVRTVGTTAVRAPAVIVVAGRATDGVVVTPGMGVRTIGDATPMGVGDPAPPPPPVLSGC